MHAHICLYTATELDPVLDRMATEMATLMRDAQAVAMIGILRRGAPLAELLTQRLVNAHQLKPPLRLDLSVKRYADDLTLLHPDTLLTEQAQQAALDLTGYTLFVVDDVLYTGHSLLKVVAYLMQRKPAAVRVACLADRCTALLPVHVDVVGLRLAIAPRDILECNVPPYETEFKINLVKGSRQTETAPANTEQPVPSNHIRQGIG